MRAPRRDLVSGRHRTAVMCVFSVGLLLGVRCAGAADCVPVLTILSDQNRQRLEIPAAEISTIAFEYGWSDASARAQGEPVAEKQTRGPESMLIEMKSGVTHRVSLNGTYGGALNPSVDVRCAGDTGPNEPTSAGGTTRGATPTPAAGRVPSPSRPSGSTSRSQSWAFSIPAQNLHYQYRFVWTGSSFTGTYVVPANNKSVFNGRLYASGGQTFIEYTQTAGSYRADYKLREVAPGRFVGTLTDSTGTFNVELTELK